jgi:hypothetical protein
MLWYPILTVLTEHGAQFCVNRRDMMDSAVHGYELFCVREIGHILCRVNHLADKVSWKSFMISIMFIGRGLGVWRRLFLGIMIGLRVCLIWMLLSLLIWCLLVGCGLRCVWV